jgi:signal transduction histidine kinase
VVSAPAVVSRVLIVAVLAACIGAVYAALPLGLGTLLGSGPTTVLSVAATAVVAVGFGPARDRVVRWVQRLVYGDRPTPYEVLAELSDRVAGASTSPEVLGHVARVVAEGSGFQSSRVWLRIDDQLTAAAAWPPGSSTPAPIALTGDELPPLPDAQLTLPVLHGDELIGAITVRQSPGEPLFAADLRLLQDIAVPAGLVLRNVRLTTELAGRLDAISVQSAEISASRERIVAAQADERRRVERDIHDGAQQHLVALMIQLRVARTLVTRNPERALQVTKDLRRIIAETLATLNDLAQGIHPPALTAHGVAAALRHHEGLLSIDLKVEDTGIGRYAPEVEAAVYFACLEALQNVSKHARGATSVSIVLSGNGSLRFDVRDNGAGFNPESATRPSALGLLSMRERAAAIGATFAVSSRPGDGTTIVIERQMETDGLEESGTLTIVMPQEALEDRLVQVAPV